MRRRTGSSAAVLLVGVFTLAMGIGMPPAGADGAVPHVATDPVYGTAGGLTEMDGVFPAGRVSVPARGTAQVQVADIYAGRALASMQAATLSLGVEAPTSSGYLTVFAGLDRPATSNLNFTAGRSVQGRALVPLATDGTVRVYNGSDAAVSVQVDVDAYTRSGSVQRSGAFHPVTPKRVADTRRGLGGSPPPARGTTTLRVLGVGGVPTSGVSAVALTLTATRTSAGGYLSAYPAGQRRTPTSPVTFRAGADAANLVIVPVGTDGAVTVFNGSSAHADVVADVAGYYTPGSPVNGSFVALPAARVADTRSGAGAAPLGPDADRAVAVAGHGGVPVSRNILGYLVAITATGGTASGTITGGGSSVTDVRYAAGQTVTATALISGVFPLHNESSGSVDLAVDVLGYVYQPSDNVGELSGRVTAADTGRPLPQVTVVLYYNVPQDDDTAVTVAPVAADGTWSLRIGPDNMTNNNDDWKICYDYPPQGNTGTPSGYRDQCFRGVDQPSTQPATIIQLIPGLATTGIDGVLNPV